MLRTIALAVFFGLIIALATFVVGCSDDSATEPSNQQSEQRQQQQSDTDSLEPQAQEAVAQSPSQDAAQQESDQAAEVTHDQPSEQQEQSAEQSQAVSDAQSQAQETQQGQAEQAAQPDQEQQADSAAEVKTKLTIGGDRPATLLIPQTSDTTAAGSLIVLLHGYGSNSREVDLYFLFSQWVDKGNFALLLPDGTTNEIDDQFWNGTPECCDLFGAEPDDVGYITSLVEEAREHVEFEHVFAVGHSNGGFMSYRLACEDLPGLIGIVTLAGGAHSTAEECRVPDPLSVLQIHGTEDRLVLYETGRLPTHPDSERRPVPGAWDSVSRWAERAQCDLDDVKELPAINTDSVVAGNETTVKQLSSGCADGTVMELWTIEGGGHVPLVWGTDFTPKILGWIAEREKSAAVATASPPASNEVLEIGGDRPAQLQLPTNRGDKAMPLVLSLHGYGADAKGQDQYFALAERVTDYGFALITPQGTTDDRGNRFWNATDGCCNFHNSDVDDHAWLSSLVAEARDLVDVSGVYVVGFSNGGFLAYRLACDGLDGLVAIASLAGSSFGDPERCADASPISVLQVHGDADQSIPYEGTLEYDGGYPGAEELVNRWAQRAGCDIEAVAVLPSIDLEADIDGDETMVQRTREGCDSGITIELWTIQGADHVPWFQNDWPDRLLDWLFSESRTS